MKDRMEKYRERRQELKHLSDEQLKERFWSLAKKVVQPMVELARTHTTPSIERSVLLRMGIDSISATAVVSKILESGLLGKGAGHVLLKVAEKINAGVKDAAAAIIENPGILEGLFGGCSK